MSVLAELDMGRILIDLSDDVIQRLDNLKQLPYSEKEIWFRL